MKEEVIENGYRLTDAVNGREIVVNCIEQDPDEGVWNLEFAQVDPDFGPSFGMTGYGGEFRIISMIRKTLQEVKTRWNPQIIQAWIEPCDRPRGQVIANCFIELGRKIGWTQSDVQKFQEEAGEVTKVRIFQ